MKDEAELKTRPEPVPYASDDVEAFENFLRSLASFFKNLFRSKKGKQNVS